MKRHVEHVGSKDSIRRHCCCCCWKETTGMHALRKEAHSLILDRDGWARSMILNFMWKEIFLTNEDCLQKTYREHQCSRGSVETFPVLSGVRQRTLLWYHLSSRPSGASPHDPAGLGCYKQTLISTDNDSAENLRWSVTSYLGRHLQPRHVCQKLKLIWKI